MDTLELEKTMCKNLEDYEGLNWLLRYTENSQFQRFRPESPPGFKLREKTIGPWLYITVDLKYSGTTMDPTTDRLSGDPYSAHVHYDWIGPSKTVPKIVIEPKELDEWAIYKSTYVQEYTDVGVWGIHRGSYVVGLTENGTLTIREGDGKFQDVDPEELTTEKTIQLELPD